jgi:hypothetical protein
VLTVAAASIFFKRLVLSDRLKIPLGRRMIYGQFFFFATNEGNDFFSFYLKEECWSSIFMWGSDLLLFQTALVVVAAFLEVKIPPFKWIVVPFVETVSRKGLYLGPFFLSDLIYYLKK